MEEIGRVVAISGKSVKVEIEPKDSCSSCAAKVFCNPSGKKMTAEVINELDAKIGNLVKIETTTKSTLFATFLLFILPLIAFGMGFGIIKWITTSENIGVLGGLGFLIIYLSLLKPLNNHLSKSKKFKPIITEILGTTENITTPTS
ncbi:SoxR reducing system RseC family protein [candidate division WOR-3 bacterium]|nr:SoxR reducing system RseC family protein [candidate division WOR-3 bacterium]